MSTSVSLQQHAPRFEHAAMASVGALTDVHVGAIEQALGLPITTLSRLTVGWSAHHRAFTFPMRNEAGQVTGVRLRARDGRKWAIKGSRDGLFIPEGLIENEDRKPLVVCEGPSDTAAMLHVGYSAIGRPSCTGAQSMVRRLAKRLDVRDVIILTDNDEPGRNGAVQLARSLASSISSIRIASPPRGIKDAREWVIADASLNEIDSVLSQATRVSLSFESEENSR